MSDARFRAVELLTRLVRAEMDANPDTCISIRGYEALSPVLNLDVRLEVGSEVLPVLVTAAFVPPIVATTVTTVTDLPAEDAVAAFIVEEVEPTTEAKKELPTFGEARARLAAERPRRKKQP